MLLFGWSGCGVVIKPGGDNGSGMLAELADELVFKGLAGPLA